MVDAGLDVGNDVGTVLLRLQAGGDRFVVSLPFDRKSPVEARRNGRLLAIAHPKTIALPNAAKPRHLEASVMDRRLTVALDGVPLFEPFDYDDPRGTAGVDESPVALGVVDGTVAVNRLRIFRDVYYTSVLANTPRQPFGVDAPYRLGPDEFFVLGDNSPVSNDSRFWAKSPVVAGELFLGKPFLVHLPGQVVPLKVFGRSVYWVPDPREIRYIR
jgi:signal peptidase I